LIHYIVEHEDAVEANWQRVEAAIAKGKPPEVEAILERSGKKTSA